MTDILNYEKCEPYFQKINFILNVSIFVKKGSVPISQNVSDFPEIGVFFGQKSAKRGGLFTTGEH